MALDPERYVIGDDGLWVEKVGSWAREKLDIVADYVQITSAARRRFAHNNPAFIDVFSGPGRSLVRSDGAFIDGSPVAAFKQGLNSLQPFSTIHISDLEPSLLTAATERLEKLNAPVVATPGPAAQAIEQIVSSLNPHGLHFALLDPHNLGSLSFSIIKRLAKLKSVDILVHVSVLDLQRNTDLYSSELQEQFDEFAPGWRQHVSREQNLVAFRAALISYWSDLLEGVSMPRARHEQLIRGEANQRLYWLMLLSKHPLAHELWEKITSVARQPRMLF
ncbi:MAG: three-Cys-motif partner protein TcmP [Burkholderiales bacterium]|nr:three-Cys-motif partner protein TcmP [Burkholderiales bacterium]